MAEKTEPVQSSGLRFQDFGFKNRGLGISFQGLGLWAFEMSRGQGVCFLWGAFITGCQAPRWRVTGVRTCAAWPWMPQTSPRPFISFVYPILRSSHRINLTVVAQKGLPLVSNKESLLLDFESRVCRFPRYS